MLVLLILLIWLQRYGLFKTAPHFFSGGDRRGGVGREDGCEKTKALFLIIIIININKQ